jgi:hypothetical protein
LVYVIWPQRYNRGMNSLVIATLILLFTGTASAHQPQVDCQSVLAGGVFTTPGKGMRSVEKYKRPPMAAFEIGGDGSVSKIRLIRHSGSKDVDEKFVASVSQWKYRARPGCGVLKVRLAAGFIPDADTAIEVAEPELNRTFGAHLIKSEKPITAGLLGDTWIVSGTLYCDDGKGGKTTMCLGGVATAHLSKADGRVLKIFHTM